MAMEMERQEKGEQTLFESDDKSWEEVFPTLKAQLDAHNKGAKATAKSAVAPGSREMGRLSRGVAKENPEAGAFSISPG